MLDEEHLEPLDAIVRTVDPRYRCVPRGRSDDIAFEVVLDVVPAAVAGEVELARISTGATFEFADRGTPVAVRPSR